jgi:hypothetical protein
MTAREVLCVVCFHRAQPAEAYSVALGRGQTCTCCGAEDYGGSFSESGAWIRSAMSRVSKKTADRAREVRALAESKGRRWTEDDEIEECEREARSGR